MKVVVITSASRHELLFASCDSSSNFQPFFEFERPVLYSIAGLGIAIVNDFKSIEGDRAMGLNSLPVAFGVDGAAKICAASVTLTQGGVAAYLYAIGEPLYAALLLALASSTLSPWRSSATSSSRMAGPVSEGSRCTSSLPTAESVR